MSAQKQLTGNRPFTRKKIEHYSYGLQDNIGKGYSSQVYRGRNDTTDEPVAIKVIDLKMLKCEINRTLLASEIEILKNMKNVPHVLTLHDVFTTKNNTYIITELCESDLSKRIKKGLPPNQVFRFMEQFLLGYSHIIDKRLVHRDLKPANLLITHDNQLKIADFGFGVKAEDVLKPSKYNVGSPLYMAPESLRRNEYSFKTDIWAIGVIFFEMLTGDTPWRAKNQKQLLKKIEAEKITDIVARHKIPQQARNFIIGSLNFDRNCRLGPDEVCGYSFTRNKVLSVLADRGDRGVKVLAERQMNRSDRYESIINQASPKQYICRSAEKRLQSINDRSDKKLPNKTAAPIQNLSLRNIENIDKRVQPSPSPNPNPEVSLQREDRKHISKLLISEVHFCRFLYKLLGRIKDSCSGGLLADLGAQSLTQSVFSYFTAIIRNKIVRLRDFQDRNFLQVDKYDDYKLTADFKKLIKISKDYFQRYSTDLHPHWASEQSSDYNAAIQACHRLIQHLTSRLQAEIGSKAIELAPQHSSDVVILDYLITCKQLLAMIRRDGENFEKFAKKSRIQEIVEGATSEITGSLYNRIIDRAQTVLVGEV